LVGNTSAGRGIEILDATSSCSKFTLDGIKVSGFGGEQLYANTMWGSRIVDCEFWGGGASTLVHFDDWCFQNLFERTLFRNIQASQIGLHNEGKLFTAITCEFQAKTNGSYNLGATGLKLEGTGPAKIVGCNFEHLHDGVGVQVGGATAMGLVDIEACYFSDMVTVAATDIGINIDALDGGNRLVRIINCEWKAAEVTTVITKGATNGYIILEPWDASNVLARCSATTMTQIRRSNSGNSTGTGAEQTIAHGLSSTPNRVIVWDIEDGALPYQSSAADATNIYITAVVNQDWGWEAKVV
jgi:hypothetical protein